MYFNLGDAGLCRCNAFLDLINKGQYEQAADDLKGTLWCSEVGNRCIDDASIITQGYGVRHTSNWFGGPYEACEQSICNPPTAQCMKNNAKDIESCCKDSCTQDIKDPGPARDYCISACVPMPWPNDDER